MTNEKQRPRRRSRRIVDESERRSVRADRTDATDSPSTAVAPNPEALARAAEELKERCE